MRSQYKVKLKNDQPNLYLDNLIPNFQALFDNLIEHTRREYGEGGLARIYIDHLNLESAIVVSSLIMKVVERVL